MIRRDFTDLSDPQKNTLANAFNKLWDDGVIENNARLHDDNFFNGIHWGPAFLPWHRDFLRKLEIELQQFDSSISLPYWDWTRSDSRDLDTSSWKEFFGGRSNTGGNFDHWTYVRSNSPGPGVLPSVEDVINELEASTFLEYRAMETGTHVPGHTWTGGTMASGRSPLDPLFYLHHCNLDRLWAIWQLNHPDAVQYEHTGTLSSDSVPQARVPIDSPMIGGATPRSMLDHTTLGYSYPHDASLERAWASRNRSWLITSSNRELSVKRVAANYLQKTPPISVRDDIYGTDAQSPSLQQQLISIISQS